MAQVQTREREGEGVGGDDDDDGRAIRPGCGETGETVLQRQVVEADRMRTFLRILAGRGGAGRGEEDHSKKRRRKKSARHHFFYSSSFFGDLGSRAKGGEKGMELMLKLDGGR